LAEVAEAATMTAAEVVEAAAVVAEAAEEEAAGARPDRRPRSAPR
jgi:hypothetical protein